MSVLVCPVCQGAMKEINKSGLLIDTCTQCRGVWLDRGELEKLATAVGGPEERSFLGAVLPPQRARRPRRDDDDDDDDRRYTHERQHKRRKSFLDFFG